jgi:hypothetical protein
MSKVSKIASNKKPLERRAEERQTMILRAGLLEQKGRTSFCLVRNVSSAGVQIRVYGTSFDVGEIVLRVADEDPIPGQLIWIEKGLAGIQFRNAVDPASLLRLQQKLRPVRRRSLPRMRATGAIAIRIGGRNLGGLLCDVSSLGAKVRTARALQVGSVAFLKLPDMPEVKAFVRWNAGLEAGFVFDTPIPMNTIAAWLDSRP